jgi:uncharacterized FAD-dependent dehydrogenase
VTKTHNADVIVIGGGPAGLSSASALQAHNVPYYLIDSGKSFQNRNHATKEDLGKGIGGSGLFSDGKFSFLPSGSQLRDLRYDLLSDAYAWFTTTLSFAGINAPIFPNKDELLLPTHLDFEGKKRYHTAYTTLSERRIITHNIVSTLQDRIFTETRAVGISRNADAYVVKCCRRGEEAFYLEAPLLIIATGRLGSVDPFIDSANRGVGGLLVPKRFEFGIRLETASQASYFIDNQESDIKYIWTPRPGLEYRTFCTCRRGEIWNINYDSLGAISGRSDNSISTFSNFGFLVRYYGPSFDRGAAIWRKVRVAAERGVVYVEPLSSFLDEPSREILDTSVARPWLPIDDFVSSSIGPHLGKAFYADLRDGLSNLVRRFPDFLERESYCFFPVIEGVGHYPDVDCELRSSVGSMWFAGDIVGNFRGLVPAFLSGYVAGLSVVRWRSSDKR